MVVAVSGELDRSLDPLAAGHRLQRRGVGTVADDQEAGVSHSAADQGQSLDQQLDSLALDQVAEEGDPVGVDRLQGLPPDAPVAGPDGDDYLGRAGGAAVAGSSRLFQPGGGIPDGVDVPHRITVDGVIEAVQQRVGETFGDEVDTVENHGLDPPSPPQPESGQGQQVVTGDEEASPIPRSGPADGAPEVAPKTQGTGKGSPFALLDRRPRFEAPEVGGSRPSVQWVGYEE